MCDEGLNLVFGKIESRHGRVEANAIAGDATVNGSVQQGRGVCRPHAPTRAEGSVGFAQCEPAQVRRDDKALTTAVSVPPMAAGTGGCAARNSRGTIRDACVDLTAIASNTLFEYRTSQFGIACSCDGCALQSQHEG